MQKRPIELAPIKETTADYERVEALIKRVFRDVLYRPLLRELSLPGRTLANSDSALLDAVASGRVTHSRGKFTGKFSAAVSRELKQLGAKWDAKSASWSLPLADLPPAMRSAINISAGRFAERLADIDKRLAAVLPEQLAEHVRVADMFDSALWKVERDIQKTLKNITVAPQLTPERRRRIADEWQNNMDLWIKDFTEKEIVRLRKNVQSAIFAGNRHESLVRSIQDSYGVTASKAKFLARQETSLLMTKFKETRYTDSGVNEYKWRCVVGSPAHPVRPSHKVLDGTVHRWDAPPITTPPGEPPRRNNPGQDYNCRCSAIPIVRFKETS